MHPNCQDSELWCMHSALEVTIKHDIGLQRWMLGQVFQGSASIHPENVMRPVP